MNSSSDTSDYYSGEKGSSYFAYQNLFANIGGRIDARKFAPLISPEDRVLDFGCGGGWILKQIVCKSKTGVEVNEHAHASCEANGIKVYKDAAEVAERDFDVITSHHCLEHVPCPISALRSLNGLLAANGKLLLVLPIDDWRIQKDYTGSDINHHLHTWTPRLLANTLAEAGFQTLEVKVLTHAWFPGWHKLYGRIPDFFFDLGCHFWGFVMRRRQLFACARKSVR